MSKKLFSIALAVLLALQLLLIPTFAEGETATGKYTTADNLPLIYGAGVSVEDFENCDSFTDVVSLNYGKLQLNSSYCNIAYSLNTDATYVAKGTKSLAVNTKQNGHLFRYFIDLRKDNVIPNYDNITFYVDLPAGSVTGTSSGNYPDGMYGIYFSFTDYVSQSVDFSKYTNYTVTYYFKDGTKLVKENQSGVYPYSADGRASTNGFEGYVSVKINDGAIASTNKYLMLGTYSKQYEGGYLSKKSYFDDFRCVDYDSFAPYALEDYEDVAEGTSATSYNATSKTWAATWYNASPSFDTTGIAQGKNSLKIACKDGGFHFGVRIAEVSANTPIFGDGYNGLAFYVDIPAYASWRGAFSPIKVVMATGYDGGTTKVLDAATYVYWFDDGSVLVKCGDDGIYPYDKNGNKVYTGFKGYVSVYYGGVDFSTYKFIRINTAQYNPGLTGGSQVVYFDDFRPCNFNVVEDIVSGDAYYIGNNAIPVQKVGDTAVLSVMTNLAKLGMARNADGIEALRNVMLGYTTAADKHNVNGIDGTDIRDLVALYKLAV